MQGVKHLQLKRELLDLRLGVGHRALLVALRPRQQHRQPRQLLAVARLERPHRRRRAPLRRREPRVHLGRQADGERLERRARRRLREAHLDLRTQRKPPRGLAAHPRRAAAAAASTAHRHRPHRTLVGATRGSRSRSRCRVARLRTNHAARRAASRRRRRRVGAREDLTRAHLRGRQQRRHGGRAAADTADTDTAAAAAAARLGRGQQRRRLVSERGTRVGDQRRRPARWRAAWLRTRAARALAALAALAVADAAEHHDAACGRSLQRRRR